MDNDLHSYLPRALLIEQIANRIASVQCAHPIRVAIDGVDAAGKTTFANELVQPLEKLGRHVIRASLDGFHNPRIIRYRRGRHSPEGCFFDSFDYNALKTHLLEPLGPDASLQYRTGIFDFRTDSFVDSPQYRAHLDSILLLDGVFLLRSELVDCWDLAIFLHVDFDVAVERAAQRDRALFGTAENTKARYWKRYVPGQRIYLRTCRPKEYADIIIDNNDPVKPRIV
jgi:uridine kinase